MIASQAGSLVDNAVFLAGLVLVGIGLIFLFSRTEYSVNLRGNRKMRSIMMFNIIIGILLMWARYNEIVYKLVNWYL